jgi:lipase
VFLHSGVGSAGASKQVFSLWPEGYRLVAIEASRDGSGPGMAGRRSLDDYADQVYAVSEHVGVSVCLVGFSWGGATALRVAAAAPELVNPLAVSQPEATRCCARRTPTHTRRPAESYGTFSSTT